MSKAVIFSKMSFILTGLTVLFVGQVCVAQIISPTAVEVQFSYVATFKFPISAKELKPDAVAVYKQQTTDTDRALYHAQHMFGLLSSPELMENYGINANHSGGIGAPQAQMNVKILSSTLVADQIQIQYRNTGKMILNKTAANKILKRGYIKLPLPINIFTIYKKECTDQHYDTLSDYWYFYNPYRIGCEVLQQSPLAEEVRIEIKPDVLKKMDLTPKLPQLRGDNGNGDLLSIYVAHGFAVDAKGKEDEGRINFIEFNAFLENKNFILTKQKSGTAVPLYIYRKDILLDNGKILKIEVRHMLANTGIETKSYAFGQFFKEAAEKADVFLYGGHSGLGGNLDIPSLEAKVGHIKFNPNKKQIYYFESCSSYSYYLQHFAGQKTKAKIDIITNGLSSYFSTSNAQLVELVKHLITPEVADVPWVKILSDMEGVLDGDSYLINVGGI